MQRCSHLRLLDLLTHNSWKVDGPCPLKAHKNIITHFCKQLPNLKVRSNCSNRFQAPSLCSH